MVIAVRLGSLMRTALLGCLGASGRHRESVEPVRLSGWDG